MCLLYFLKIEGDLEGHKNVHSWGQCMQLAFFLPLIVIWQERMFIASDLNRKKGQGGNTNHANLP